MGSQCHSHGVLKVYYTITESTKTFSRISNKLGRWRSLTATMQWGIEVGEHCVPCPDARKAARESPSSQLLATVTKTLASVQSNNDLN